VQKAFRQGFYWPSAVADAHNIVRQCPECQRHAPYSKFASNEIQLIPPVWPFVRWGIDIVGSLPTAPGNYTRAVVAIEYFFQMGRSKANVEHYFNNNTEVFLAKHRVPLRRATRSHRGQWQAV
jgi:hypothetical protein